MHLLEATLLSTRHNPVVAGFFGIIHVLKWPLHYGQSKHWLGQRAAAFSWLH
jgi:hypothetical protein